MKKYFLLLSALVISLSLTAQWSNKNIENKYCHSLRSSEAFKKQTTEKTVKDKYDVKFYKLDISAERTATTVSGNVEIYTKVVSAQLDTFCFDLLSQLTVDSIKINGVKKTVYRNGDKTYVRLSPALTATTSCNAKIYYHGTPPSGGFFSGISNATSPSWGNKVTWTLSEPFNAYQWWPCKQDLTDKADSCWVFITTSSDNKAGSNGILTNIVTVGGKKRYEWKHRHPIDYYLISFSVAQYIDYSIYAHPAGTTDSILIQNYVYNNADCLLEFKDEIDQTKDFIELYSDKFGMYPYKNEKYGHCMAPIGGGMEHQTMTTLGFFEFYLVCHELSHQWFGDYVTCGTWNDIWINEGFASYAEYIAAENLVSLTEAKSHMLDVHTNVMSLPGGSVYIPLTETLTDDRIFDGRLSYNKGSAIIHMIRFELQNDVIFFNVLKDFIATYKNSTATGMDFKGIVESFSRRDFTDFFNQWYFGEGYPTYSVLWTKKNDTITLNVTQTTSSTATPLFKMLMEYKLKSASGDTIVKVRQTANSNTFKIHTHKTITNIEVDPNNWVLNKVGSIILEVDEPNTINFSISPNPCKDKIQLVINKFERFDYMAHIMDLTGKILLEEKITQPNTTIDIQSLAKGIYLLKIANEKSLSVQKIIKE